MMSKVRRETMMLSDLPRELEWEILSRVAATSLVQLRTTCKRWYALFKDPRFIDKNLVQSGTHQVILKKDYRAHSVNLNLHHPTIEFTGTLKRLEDSKHVEIDRIFVCDGLFLCTTTYGRLVVCNPCTGQTRWIIKPISSNILYSDYTLGYVNNNTPCKSYKILRTCYEDTSLGFEIYDFSSDSWRIINYVTHSLVVVSKTGVSLKGDIYWVAWERGSINYPKTFLLRFDFRRERFERLSLPFDYPSLYVTLAVGRQEKLHVLLQRPFQATNTIETKLWVTDTMIIDEAKDTYKIQYSLVADLSTTMINNQLIYVNSFLVDKENRLVVCYGDGHQEKGTIIGIFGAQDHHIHSYKHVNRGVIAQGTVDPCPRLISYVPSLVQIH